MKFHYMIFTLFFILFRVGHCIGFADKDIFGELNFGIGEIASKDKESSFKLTKNSFTADARFIILPINLGIGYRYETDEGTKTINEFYNDYYSFVRHSLLLNYRIINNSFYLGPVFTYGLSHDLTVNSNQLNSTFGPTPLKVRSSYTLSLESGFHWNIFLLGIDVGARKIILDSSNTTIETFGKVTLGMQSLFIGKLIGTPGLW